jgi:formamidopyrimidine-DNA glycosylase
MIKKKRSTHKYDEENLGIMRAQKKQIKRLQQEIKRLEKQLGYRQNKIEDLKTFEYEEPNCPDCKNGYLKEITVVGRKLTICGNCTYRTRAVKI